MELDFNSVGVDIWFLPHVRYVVLSNYFLYSSIRWSPPVMVIGHRILRLEIAVDAYYYFLFLCSFYWIILRLPLIFFYTLSLRNHRSISSRERWTFLLPFCFRIERERERRKGASSLTLVRWRGRMRSYHISIHTHIQLLQWYFEEKSRDIMWCFENLIGISIENNCLNWDLGISYL
jgi:hypothetical protein